MPKYLIQANFALEGVKGVLKEGGTNRLLAVEKTAQSMGGKLESFYFAFGGVDVYVIVDLPDNAAAAAMALTVTASGAVVAKTTVLLTPEEMDVAVKKTPIYRAPGQ
ncbi:MAG: GYD domain-containing protein [Anaerolineaceae bacterium]|nr:GYD domain-containing protein [Anaerolineaceae bacterium]